MVKGAKGRSRGRAKARARAREEAREEAREVAKAVKVAKGKASLRYKPPLFAGRLPFDLMLCEPIFQRGEPLGDDSDFTHALLKCNRDLSPTVEEMASIVHLVTKVTHALNNLMVSPGDFDGCKIQEIRLVGSFKKGTMLRGKNVADLVIIMKSLPTRISVDSLGSKLVEILHTQQQEYVAICTTDEGFELRNPEATVRILVATVRANLSHLNPKLHLDGKILENHFAAIRHSRWFEETVHHSSVKVLIRLLRDLQNRFAGLKPLSIWMLDLLSHRAVKKNPAREVVALNVAYRRCLQLLAAGLFLPGSAGITDPCEVGNIPVHTLLSLKDQDEVCFTAQTLLRVLMHGGYKRILGLDGPTAQCVLSNVTLWKNVRVSPSQKVYKKNKPTEDEENAAPVEVMAEGFKPGGF